MNDGNVLQFYVFLSVDLAFLGEKIVRNVH